ncbi:reverse transcriptase [Gossypium australe]|uniref:Reverse transcriptase n=1 Tax=Gossypium australe TaxID=47621 RepID=A0A5B6VLL9_9ROSI|nr:reverse transcriptase [Gossypium australe]
MEEKVSIIRTHLKAAQDQQKVYVDRKRKNISFEIGDKTVSILTREVKELRNKRILLVKVLLRNHNME